MWLKVVVSRQVLANCARSLLLRRHTVDLDLRQLDFRFGCSVVDSVRDAAGARFTGTGTHSLSGFNLQDDSSTLFRVAFQIKSLRLNSLSKLSLLLSS